MGEGRFEVIHPYQVPRETISELFTQALVGWDKAAHGSWLDVLERLTRLIEAEHQTVQMQRAHRRAKRKPDDSESEADT